MNEKKIMKTILFLSRSSFPNLGGVEKHIYQISKVLIGKGYNMIIISESSQKTYSSNYHSNEVSAKDVENGLKSKNIRIDVGGDNWFKKFRIWLQLLKHIKVIASSDIVHCHDVFFWYLPFRFVFPFKKVYVTFHGYEGNSLPSKKAIFMHKLAEVLSNGNICVGDFLKKWYGTNPTFVTYGAIDTKLLKKRKVNLKIKRDIIFAGRLEKETGILEYLKAIYILQTRGIKLSLDIFGDGQLMNQAKKTAIKNKIDASFKGFIPNVTDYLPNYKYVFVSRYLGILEALALKLPIFAEYNNAIKKDYLQMAPFAKYISISKNAKEIATSIEKQIKSNKTLDLGGGVNWVKNQTWENMVEIYLKLWKKN
ncbi:MAG: glycosyltransferase family 4 protein [Candidatus Levybacteria bacterium]|nr:glycosyltransferase family 4 protein [Candidatus Levybacteria bacterium]